MRWRTTRFQIDLGTPRIMGVVNVTPDSFSDGGDHATAAAALRHCERLVAAGADMLDVGGESTRPGSPPLPPEEELARIRPVVLGALQLGVPVSVDTSKPGIMQVVLDAGVDIINDVSAMRDAAARRVVAAHPSCGICLMHMHGEPSTMQVAPMEGDAVPQVRAALAAAAGWLRDAGIGADRIVLDPGIGFGKTVEQNFELLARQRELLDLGYPLLVGWSRKSSLGAALRDALGATVPPKGRMVASVAAALLALERGASIVRVHDVRETAEALAIWRRVHAPDAGCRDAG